MSNKKQMQLLIDAFDRYGDYEIEATRGGKTVTQTVRLFRDNTGYDNRRCDFRTKNIVIADHVK